MNIEVKQDLPTILLIAPRGEVFRNFIYSGITKYLRQNNRLILLSVIPNREFSGFLKGECDVLYELKEFSLLSRMSKQVYDFIELVHNRLLWSTAAKWRWNARVIETKKGYSSRGKDLYDGAFGFKRSVGMAKAVFILKVKQTIAGVFANNWFLFKLESLLFYLSKKETLVSEYVDLLKREKVVFAFNGSHIHAKSAYPVMQAARIANIKSGTFLFSWDNLTSQGRIIPLADYYFAWNTGIRNDLVRIYKNISENQVIVTGTSQFVGHFKPENLMKKSDFLKKIGLNGEDSYILYSVGMSHHMPYEPIVVERIADELRKMYPKLRLVIRTYAKDPSNAFDDLKNKRPDIIFPEVKWVESFLTPLPEDQVFFSNLLQHCALGINVASTVSLELCMFNKPVINIAYDPPGKNVYPYNFNRFYEFEHYKPLLNYGAISVAENEADLFGFITQYVDNPELNGANRLRLINDFFEIEPNQVDKLRSIEVICNSFQDVIENCK